MILKAIKFCRFKGTKHEWSIEGKPIDAIFNQWATFTDINLIVGMNATGKSKTLMAILQIADLLAGNVKLSNLVYDTSTYHLEFDDEGQKIDYYLDFKDKKVVQETLSIDGVEKLNRKESRLYYEQVGFLSFQIEDNISAISQVNNKQQPFFVSLNNWAKNLNFYRFGKEMGRGGFIKDAEAVRVDDEVNLKDEGNVPQVFVLGKLKFQKKFEDIIIQDMNNIGYKISTIDTKKFKHIPSNSLGISVKEADLDDITDQREMSQGMFRALSLLIQLNYSLLSEIPSCILIDDIGEGLDFDRSKSLIDLIIEKVKDSSSVQVIMTTNDRFVMNKIPLEYWSVIHRVPKKSLFYNYRNSRETFEEYKYSGLSNFDFLATEFYLTGFETEVA